MLPNDDPTYTMRLALSYLETAQVLIERCKQQRESDALDEQQYQTVQHFYSGHLHRATHLLDTLREEQRNRLTQLSADIERIETERTQIVNQLSGNELRPKEANKRHRTLVAELATLQKAVSATQKAISAVHSKDLGGQINHPIEDFQALLSQQTQPRPQSQGIRKAPLILLGAVCAIVVVGLALSQKAPSTVHVAFNASTTNDGVIYVECTNQGSREIALFAPWPEGIPAVESQAHNPQTHFGIEVYIQETPYGPFRLLQNSNPYWKRPGFLTLQQDSMIIFPGMTSTTSLDTQKLRRQGIKPHVLRLKFTRADGKEMGQFETRGPSPQ